MSDHSSGTARLDLFEGYLRLLAGDVARTVQVSDWLMVDVDAQGRVLGIETIGGLVDFGALVTVLREAVFPPSRAVDNPVDSPASVERVPDSDASAP